MPMLDLRTSGVNSSHDCENLSPDTISLNLSKFTPSVLEIHSYKHSHTQKKVKVKTTFVHRCVNA